MEVMEVEDLPKVVKDVLEKLQEQNQVISLLQTEVEFQNDRISKQEGLIKDLTLKVEELTKKITENKSNGNRDEESNNVEDIWKETKNLSIADAVKETAEKTLMTNLGFVYDSNTKLYCNYSTGYYFDPAQELYYNGHTGTYYTYDSNKQEYRFHSQVEIPGSNNNQPTTSRPISKNKYTAKKRLEKNKANSRVEIVSDEDIQIVADIKKSKSKEKGKRTSLQSQSSDVVIIDPAEVEEGEVSDSSSSSSEENESGIEGESDTNCPDSVNLTYPPCIRAIVLESSCNDIKKGSLFLITCTGGTIGREGSDHVLLLPDDPQIEKKHAQIQYIINPNPNEEEDSSEKYFISDFGSRNGTILNGNRLSEEKIVSSYHEIVHGSIVKIGGFSILMHIHPGTFTCGHCEPGLLMETDTPSNDGSHVSTIASKGPSRNALMRQIKKKYGIERPPNPGELSNADNYKDRAQQRRVVKGSDNPFEKTQVATLDESIGETNKGFKMLKKMGWSAGKSLGQTGGLVEPIKPHLKNDRGGLGLQDSSKMEASSTSNKTTFGKKSKHNQHSPGPRVNNKADRLAITMKRFKEAEEAPIEVDLD